MFKSIGVLKYFNNPYKLIVSVDEEISKYYRSLIPKYFYVQKPMYGCHISVIRNEVYIPNFEFWEKYQNIKITFNYENIIYDNELYFWLNVVSPDLENIRLELGLPNISQLTQSPDGKHKFHITIGNTKHFNH